MPDGKTFEPHPIKLVREAIGQLPEESGAYRLSKVRDFSRWVGCSESLIRNVEKRVVNCSPKLARAIESKTEVSEKWLLRPGATKTPIIDRKGKPWSAERLDLFCKLPNFEKLLVNSPTLLPSIVANMIEAQMLSELHRGELKSLLAVMNLLDRRNFFDQLDPAAAAISLTEAKGSRASHKAIGIGLLMSQSPDLSADQFRNLEVLRGGEPSFEEEDGIAKLFTEKGKKMRRKEFVNARHRIE